MYSPSSGRTMIKVGGGGNDGSKAEPLYSVPIQTTATLNIQLLPHRASAQRPGGSAAATSVHTSGPVNAAVTATRVNIVAQVHSRPASSIISDDSTFTLGTQTDRSPEALHAHYDTNGARPPGYDTTASQDGRRRCLLSDASQTDVFPVDPDAQNSSVPTNSQNRRTGDFSETGSQVDYSASASLIDESYIASSTLKTTGSSPVVPVLSVTSDGPSPVDHWSSSSSSMTSGAAWSAVQPVTASILATSNSDKHSEDDGGNEYRVFTDAGGGKIGAGEATIRAKQLAQGIQRALTLSDQSSGTQSRDDDDDDDSDDGWEELGKPADPSTFNLIEWDLPNEKSSKQLACHRVIIMKDKDMVLMLTAACSTQKTGNDPRMLSLMAEIADNCSKRLKKMKTLPNLRAEHMDTLPLSDGRPTKEHLISVSKTLRDNIGIKEVAYRFQPADDVYMGTFVQGTVLAKRNFAIGKVGVVAVLFKKSKYATVEAFSEQLCEHIAIAQPTTLGHLSDSDLRKLNRRGTTRIQHLQKDQLLVQNFIFDATIIVAEAARRSFVRIEDFLLFK